MDNVCSKLFDSSLHTGYFYDKLKTNSDQVDGYDLFKNNCIQVSAKLLIDGKFAGNYECYRIQMKKIPEEKILFNFPAVIIPNYAYNLLRIT